MQQTRRGLELIEQIRRRGVAIVVITHNVLHAFQVADRIVVLRHGRIAPSANTLKPYAGLPGEPVLAGGLATGGDSALVLASGAGGDATSMVIEYEGGDLP